MMVASTGLSQESSIRLDKVDFRETGTTGPPPGLTSVTTPAVTAALMMWRRQ